MNPLLTVVETAKLLNFTEAAIRKWIHQRRLTPVKIGRGIRLRLEDIEAVATKGLPEPGQAVQPVRRAPRSRQEPRSGGETPQRTAGVREGAPEPLPTPA
jgi:excisionase family DNA binding protein